MKTKIKEEDRRTRYTKNAIKDALLSLLKKERFDRLSVASVCREADVGRSTFYTHYDTLLDVADDLADDAIRATQRPEGEPLQAISDLASLLRRGGFPEEELNRVMLQLPVCQRVADNPKYTPLFRDPFLSDHLMMQIYRREKVHMLPIFERLGLNGEEATAIFLFAITGSFAVNRDHGWKKDDAWLRKQRVLMTFLDGGYKELRKL